MLTVFIFFRTDREPQRGGRASIVTQQQETAIVDMVRENNSLTLKQIQTRILADNTIFNDLHTISISTIHRILQRNLMTMKQVYRVPFQRNTDRTKALRREYVLVSPIHSSLTHACIVPVYIL